MKVGDRIVLISETFSAKPGERGTVVEWSSIDLGVRWDNFKHYVDDCDCHYLGKLNVVHENIYDSPLYKALDEKKSSKD